MSENSGGSYDVKGLNLFRSFPVEAQGDGPLLSFDLLRQCLGVSDKGFPQNVPG